jgi:hypothetical protein
MHIENKKIVDLLESEGFLVPYEIRPFCNRVNRNCSV